MQTHDLIQGTPEWHAYRAEHDNASDAPAMMGVSSYKTREQLLAECATGIVPEVDAATQRRFKDGHRFEALARPMAEKIIGAELAPLVGSDGKFSASFDGLTLMEDTAFEHKTLNNELRAALWGDECTGADLPLVYQVQMEQQCMVSGCARVLFMASKWKRVPEYSEDDERGWRLVEERHCWYTPNIELRAKIVAGWEQFHKDVAAYVAPDVAPVKVVAESVTTLPVVFCRVSGDLVVKHSLPAFEVAWSEFLEKKLIREPETDQDFATLEQQVKAMEAAEAQLDASEESALSETEVLSQFIVLKRALRDMVCEQRKASKKQLTEKKESIKQAQVLRGQKAFAEHMESLNARLGKPYMPQVPTDFPGAIKGKRTVDSLRDAVNTELARAKIAANDVADRIQVNLTTLRELASQHAFLFADTAQIVLKANDDCTTLVKSRIAEHQAAEKARLEAERERIRVEEQAKAQCEVADAACRAAEEEQARARAAAAIAQAATPAPAPSPAPTQEAQATAVAPAAPARPVTHATTTPPTLKLGEIAARLGFALPADFLKTLGFEPAGRERGAVLFHESSWPSIRAALIEHIANLPELQTA